jgi:hypothetical protein
MAVAGGARGRANYDELIKLLLIGDSGEEEEDSWCGKELPSPALF